LDGANAPSIEVTTSKKANQVYLIVTDNGAGFPVEILSRAFEPYMTTKRHGTGLGLAIVKKIVEEHQGTIIIENVKVEASRKTGAVVIVSLPLHLETSKRSSVKRKKAEQV
jgi:nitrogen fixation/metabolism regulation signal transduction histidine kinase